MSRRSLNGEEWTEMVLVGSENLSLNEERINALNVFPVPDGDTGSNMHLTMSAGVSEISKKNHKEVGKAAEALSKGLLMGARGNSGVILSQLFRGFAQAISKEQKLDVISYANALQVGVNTAYKAVVKPVEGTILTVAKEAASHAVKISRRVTDLTELVHEVYLKASKTLEKTPNMLPVLKEVGVVDSGGQGLVCIYEGFYYYLIGEQVPSENSNKKNKANASAPQQKAQTKLATESIKFPYDMEFFIQLSAKKPYTETRFRNELEKYGDSIILIRDKDKVKVHVHSNRPGEVLNAAIVYGALTQMNLLNMQEQHRDLLAEEKESVTSKQVKKSQKSDTTKKKAKPATSRALADLGVIAVSVGAGNEQLFKSLGVDVVLSGGQSMNPSTKDLVSAIQTLSAENILVLPNNSNIILTAKQAVEMSENRVTVIPSRTIQQGMVAMLAFREFDTLKMNEKKMLAVMKNMISGSVTKAVRKTELNGITIKKGDFIGIKDKDIVASESDLLSVCQSLLQRMFEANKTDTAVLTCLSGEGSNAKVTDALTTWLAEHFSEAEIEVHEGGQPLYPYLFGLEF